MTRQARRFPTREAQCPMCGELHFTCGQTGRKSNTCETCYPIYRQADVILATVKYRCKQQGLDYDLDVKWLFDKLINGCERTGQPFNLNAKSPSMKDRAPDGPSIDKIDPNKGYTKDNCQVVLWWYNCAKQRFSDEDMKRFCQMVIDYVRPS